MKHEKMTKDIDLLKHGILYSKEGYTVRKAKNGLEIYKEGFTHATRCGIVSYSCKVKTFERAMQEIDRRLERGKGKTEKEAIQDSIKTNEKLL